MQGVKDGWRLPHTKRSTEKRTAHRQGRNTSLPVRCLRTNDFCPAGQSWKTAWSKHLLPMEPACCTAVGGNERLCTFAKHRSGEAAQHPDSIVICHLRTFEPAQWGQPSRSNPAPLRIQCPGPGRSGPAGRPRCIRSTPSGRGRCGHIVAAPIGKSGGFCHGQQRFPACRIRPRRDGFHVRTQR